MQATDHMPQQAFAPGETQWQRPLATPSNAVHSADLLKGQKSVVIDHNGQIYRLQATKLGKLILTK